MGDEREGGGADGPGRKRLGGRDHAEPTVTVVAPGQLLAQRYRVLERVAAGGMGVVFKAEDERLARRVVALKVLPPDLAGDAGATKRLKAEALAAIDLHHPNVMGLNGLETDGPTWFLVMEYLDGPTLDEALADRGRFSVAEVLEVARQVCPALAYAHARGVVHRDVKPANLMYKTEAGRRVLKVADFGVAYQVRESMARVTGQDVSAGTLAYLPPEQLAGVPCSARSDQYSLAVTLYELLAGNPPFQGSGAALLHQIERAAPFSPPDVPAPVAAVLARALAKQPAERFEGCLEFLAALEASAAPGPLVVSASPEAPRRKAPFVAFMVSALVVAMALGAAWRAFVPGPDQALAAAEREVARLGGLDETYRLGDAAYTPENASTRAGPAPDADDLRRTVEALRARLDLLKLEGAVAAVGPDRVRVVVPCGPGGVPRVRALLAVAPGVEFREVLAGGVPALGSRDALLARTGPDTEVLQGFAAEDLADDLKRWYLVRRQPDLRCGVASARVEVSQETQGPTIALQLVPDGAKGFESLTGRLVGKQLAIVLLDVVVEAATVQAPIAGGQVQISGVFDPTAAARLVGLLNADAPFPLVLVRSPEARARSTASEP